MRFSARTGKSIYVYLFQVVIIIMLSSSKEVLEKVFGYTAFRKDQETIIEHVIAGHDSVVLMPTGGGKSLCYQIPALVRPGVAVVVSPLISLMRDQVQALLQYGVKAAYLNSSLGAHEQADVITQLRKGELDLIYVAPERLVLDSFMCLLSTLDVSLVAIDEAHCVSQWGHDFRPDYLRLSELAEHLPDVPRIALTATADEPTRLDIFERLSLNNARLFCSGFDRPNIRYQVTLKNNAKNQLLNFINENYKGESGIVYCLSRKKVEQTAAWLNKEGFNAVPYHAGLTSEQRQQHQDIFIRDEGVIVVATVAFGMGIDKPNVRFVAHLDLPKSLEAYYQETGRAGRDGLPATAWMVYGLGDVVSIRQMLDSSDAGEKQKLIEQRKLNAILGYCETASCRRGVLLGYFGDSLEEACGNCDTCLEPVESWEGTKAAQQALSCVFRTGQRFGASYLVDVLLGCTTERIERFEHDKISTYGIGVEHSRSQWLSIFRQMVAMGLLSVDMSGYGGLQLTEESREVLAGKQPVTFRKDPQKAKSVRRKSSGRVLDGDIDKYRDDPVFEALRTKRLEIATEQAVPPYVIFHDKTLLLMVKEKPKSLESMSEISGVGESKLKRYGEAFIRVIAEQSGA
jgi:ATP-dependent DNA helicase RecQ